MDKDNLNFGDKKIDFVLMKMKWNEMICMIKNNTFYLIILTF
jgi:hypothetical protein